MLNIPAISAVIPAYNAANYIRETIESLLNQTLRPNEIIVVDDASTDDTALIVEEMADKYESIKFMHLSENVGVSAARNLGIEVSKADFIVLMDADDVACSNLLEMEYEAIVQKEILFNARFALCHSSYIYIDETGSVVGPPVKWKQVLPEETLGYQFIRNNIITPSGVIIKRDILIEMHGFNTNLKRSEDHDLWLRIAAKYGFAYVDEPLVKVRRHANNASRSLDEMLKSERRILESYPLDYIEKAIYKRHLPWWENKADYAELLYKLEHWDEGYVIVGEILSRKQDYPKAFFLEGLYYLKKGHFDEALTSFEKTISLNKNHGAALNNIGALFAINGDIENAVLILQRAIELYPDYLDATHNLKMISANNKLTISDARFTWRELRPVLIRYVE